MKSSIEKEIQIPEQEHSSDTFNIGTKVPKDGVYTCVPCGNVRRFSKGEMFPRCFKCLEEKQYNDDKYMKNLGLWELMREE